MQHTVKGCREPRHNKHVRPREHMRIKWTAVHFAVEANVATVSRKRSRQINGTHWLRQLVRAGARLTAGVIEIAIHNQNALPKALGTCARAGTKWNVIGHGLFQILGRLCGDRELCRRSGCKEEPAMFASEDSTPGLVSPLCGTGCSADAYPHFNAIRDGRSDHGIVATLLGRCDRVILELSLVGFLSPLARKFDTYP